MVYAVIVIIALFVLNELEMFNLYQIRRAHIGEPSVPTYSDYQQDHDDELQRFEDSKKRVRGVLILASGVLVAFGAGEAVTRIVGIFSSL